MRHSTASLVVAFCTTMAVQAAPLSPLPPVSPALRSPMIHPESESHDLEERDSSVPEKRSIGGFAYHQSSNELEKRFPNENDEQSNKANSLDDNVQSASDSEDSFASASDSEFEMNSASDSESEEIVVKRDAPPATPVANPPAQAAKAPGSAPPPGSTEIPKAQTAAQSQKDAKAPAAQGIKDQDKGKNPEIVEDFDDNLSVASDDSFSVASDDSFSIASDDDMSIASDDDNASIASDEDFSDEFSIASDEDFSDSELPKSPSAGPAGKSTSLSGEPPVDKKSNDKKTASAAPKAGQLDPELDGLSAPPKVGSKSTNNFEDDFGAGPLSEAPPPPKAPTSSPVGSQGEDAKLSQTKGSPMTQSKVPVPEDKEPGVLSKAPDAPGKAPEALSKIQATQGKGPEGQEQQPKSQTPPAPGQATPKQRRSVDIESDLSRHGGRIYQSTSEWKA